MFKLYYSPGACSLASHIALVDSGAPYELQRVDFGKGEQRQPDYLAINAKGRVPVLATPQGRLTETPAILAFIAQSYPQKKLAPSDPFAFAETQAFNSYLCSTVHVAHAHRMRGHRWATEESSFEDMRRMIPKSVGDAFALIETQMLRGPWVMGETYTIADPYLFTVSLWLDGDGVDVSKLPRVMEHRARMGELASVKRALSEEGVS